MGIKRGIEEHRDLFLVLLTAAAAFGMYQYSQSINETPTEYVLVEFLDELPDQTGMGITGNFVQDQPPPMMQRLLNEPPSAYRYRTKYGCYKRCTCSYADTCQCFYGGCFTVGDEPEVRGIEHEPYKSVGEKRLNTMMIPSHRRFYGPDK